MDKVSFVIRTKNEARDIKQTISAIRRQNCLDGIEIEIILVDNMSTDGTVEIVKDDIDKIIYIEDADFSWGRAINIGIEQAKGEFIVLISGHCILASENVLAETLDVFYKHDIVALYGMQIGDEKKDKFECLELKCQYPNLNYFEFKYSEHGIGISNAACMLKKSIWERFKFDETLNSAEDAVWCKTIRENHMRCGYSNCLKVIHGHYFNPIYIYRKWYWRTKVVDRNRNPILVHLISNRTFYILKSIRVFFKYKRLVDMSDNKVKISSIYAYARLCEWPRYIARMDFKKASNDTISYNDIIVSQKAILWGKKIIHNEKYGI